MTDDSFFSPGIRRTMEELLRTPSTDAKGSPGGNAEGPPVTDVLRSLDPTLSAISPTPLRECPSRAEDGCSQQESEPVEFGSSASNIWARTTRIKVPAFPGYGPPQGGPYPPTSQPMAELPMEHYFSHAVSLNEHSHLVPSYDAEDHWRHEEALVRATEAARIMERERNRESLRTEVESWRDTREREKEREVGRGPLFVRRGPDERNFPRHQLSRERFLVRSFGDKEPQRRQPPPKPMHRHTASISSDSHNSTEGSDAGSSDGRGEDPEEGRDEYKRFLNQFRAEKTEKGYDAAVKYASAYLRDEQAPLKWRVWLELADTAKKEDRIEDARAFFLRACEARPSVTQSWIEYIKMEEEIGEMKRCKAILFRALQHCPKNDTLVLKALKLLERIGDFTSARAILSLMRKHPEKTWRIILEGAHLEARQLNLIEARRIIQWLVYNVTGYGPLYLDAAKFEEKQGDVARAIGIARKGLAALGRYGPLWFTLLRLYEKGENYSCIDPATHSTITLESIREIAFEAKRLVTRELQWRILFDLSQIEARKGNTRLARNALVASVDVVPPNLRWKVWLGGARTEILYLADAADRRALPTMLSSDEHTVAPQTLTRAQLLLNRALSEIQKKIRHLVLLECARTEEFFGNLQVARQILRRARKDNPKEWKLWLESALLEIRDGEKEAALLTLQEATAQHAGTGRLWALLIQCAADQEKIKTFKRALEEVPKSGEVWCEGARIYMDPSSSHFNLEIARQYLHYAIQFTPQYGDSFLELLRLFFLRRAGDADTSLVEQQCYSADPNYGVLWFKCKKYPYEGPAEVLKRGRQLILKELRDHRALYQRRLLSKSGELDTSESSLSLAMAKYTRDRELEGYAGHPLLIKACTCWEKRASAIFGPDPIST